jgi:hypothetical protein
MYTPRIATPVVVAPKILNVNLLSITSGLLSPDVSLSRIG